MNVGDRLKIQGMTATVVAVISDGKFTADYPAEIWGYLERGVLFSTDEAGLIHYPDLDGFEIERILTDPLSRHQGLDGGRDRD